MPYLFTRYDRWLDKAKALAVGYMILIAPVLILLLFGVETVFGFSPAAIGRGFAFGAIGAGLVWWRMARIERPLISNESACLVELSRRATCALLVCGVGLSLFAIDVANNNDSTVGALVFVLCAASCFGAFMWLVIEPRVHGPRIIQFNPNYR